jgi:hypothetical protein
MRSVTTRILAEHASRATVTSGGTDGSSRCCLSSLIHNMGKRSRSQNVSTPEARQILLGMTDRVAMLPAYRQAARRSGFVEHRGRTRANEPAAVGEPAGKQRRPSACGHVCWDLIRPGLKRGRRH